jgi:leucyl-tRNA synthetase
MKAKPKDDHQKLEKKWQARWAKSKYARALDGSKKKKTYLLVEFP